MKKNISRILSLILVLAMLVSVMPMALAADTGSGSGSGDSSQTGGNTEGGNTEGGNTEGGNTEGGNTEGGNTEGGNTEGGNTEGGNTEGGNTEGGNTEGGNTEGGNTEGGNTEGGTQKPELKDIKISVPAGTIYTGSTVTLTVKADPAGADLPAGTVTWSTNAPNGVLDTSKAGTVTVTASLGGHSDEVQLTVKDKLVIECNDATAGVGETVYLEPVLKLNDKTVSSRDSVITAASTDFDADDYNGYIVVQQKYYTAETGKVTIFASTTGTDGKKIETSKTVDVTFYDGSNLKITLDDSVSNFYFSDDDVVEYYSVGSGSTRSGNGYSVGELIEYNMDNADAAYYGFEMGSSSGGSLECASASSNGGYDLRVSLRNLYNVRFIQRLSASRDTTFAVYALSSSNKVLSTLYVTLTAGNAASGIEYSTTANRAVTFNARDFYDYWNEMATSGSLSYVKFSSPTSGTLYADSARRTRVTSSMTFYYSNTSTSSNSYALSGVTFLPTTSTAQYTVEIPFVAYGTGSKTVSGSVVVKVNEQSSTIGARGIPFSSIAETIAQNYYMSTKKNLGFVEFTLPSAQYGTIYVMNGTSVADATRAQTGDRFYYGGTYNYNSWDDDYYENINSPLFGINGTVNGSYNWVNGSANKYSLEAASLVPAAGFSGKLTVNYAAYNTNGTNGMSGSITFTVQTQNASKVFNDVTVSSYSWAADAVDFLYYEGVAQGSNGRYNPKANITRGDFMLMLYRAFLENSYKTYSVTSNFPDVVKGSDSYSQEIYQAVGVAKYLGIAQGTNDKFNPKANITREEAVTLIDRTLDKVGRTLRYRSGVSAASFTDYKDIGSWATASVADMVTSGVIQGSNNRITPKANITRAEMACILHRVITY